MSYLSLCPPAPYHTLTHPFRLVSSLRALHIIDHYAPGSDETMPAPPPLDHLILLVPDLSSTSFLAANGFSLLPGGTHADGLTENALIVLPDGICAHSPAPHFRTTKPSGPQTSK